MHNGYSSSYMIMKNSSDDGYILVLKKRRGNVLEKIYLDEDKDDVSKIEVFNGNGTLAYRAEFYGRRNINGYRIPDLLVFSNGSGSMFQLNVDRYWADVSISPSVFGLTPPE